MTCGNPCLEGFLPQEEDTGKCKLRITGSLKLFGSRKMENHVKVMLISDDVWIEKYNMMDSSTYIVQYVRSKNGLIWYESSGDLCETGVNREGVMSRSESSLSSDNWLNTGEPTTNISIWLCELRHSSGVALQQTISSFPCPHLETSFTDDLNFTIRKQSASSSLYSANARDFTRFRECWLK
ncbi:hypothetical protein MAR_018477 [Mya arenaria]|uniref:Uncharacterized protein n=1 Tax=Mya arenaria TaxID=6604 RepID=A0ABY7EH83_MYAAR|nr:hypothetical protein MAR_018477 [Mya arenaria]